MKVETVIFAVLLVSIALTLSACTPQEIAEFDAHQKDVLVTFTTPQAEPQKMIDTFTRAEIAEIINPYFSIQNLTDEIFRVDHAGNIYLYTLNSSGKLYTDAGGKILNGTDADTTYTNTSFDLSQLVNTGNVNIGVYNFSVNDSVLFVDSTNGMVGIGTTSPFDTLHIIGDLELEHTSIETNDHAFEIDVDAAGFGDVKAIDIVYITGAISLGSDDGIILIGIDESLATGGDVFGLEVLATEGLANIYGLKAGALVGPIHQDSGVFENMDSVNNSGVDALTNFTSSDTDSLIFVNDNDFIIIGDAAKFEELEFLLNTSASNPGIKPTFEFSTGVGTWDTLVPTDGTNGMRNTGIISWEDGDIPTWETGFGTEYLIRINRTQNTLSTVPMEDKVQISATTEYVWDKDANLRVNQVNATAFYDDGVLLVDTDTNASTECSGTTTYLDGEGNCNDISSIYAPITHGDEWNKTYADILYAVIQWNKTYADTLYTNDTDTNTNCSVANTCSAIVYSGNTSWITTNQNYNTTEEIFNVVDNGTFIKTDTDTNLTEDNVEAYIFDADNTASLETAGNITGEGATFTENATINGLHIDKMNSTHWKLWG